MIWRAFEAAAPNLAEVGRKRLERPGLALLGTIRRDGSPRISPIELHIVAGHLLFGVMRSGKRHDLARDPRCTLHSAVTDPDGADGEFKVHGRATLVMDPALRDASDTAWWRAFPADAGDVYSMDLESAALVRWDSRRGQLSIEEWTRDGGLREVRRPYP
ncbi:MAG: pyridoxamine 5'-phosphate oxidase family protein [Chloroflexi bacterium]|nr:pyridoxamine 5'-phosphate oxidase family protein [Chloroflexota bacterium]